MISIEIETLTTIMFLFVLATYIALYYTFSALYKMLGLEDKE